MAEEAEGVLSLGTCAGAMAEESDACVACARKEGISRAGKLRGHAQKPNSERRRISIFGWQNFRDREFSNLKTHLDNLLKAVVSSY
jgi:hypothetical protein